MIPHPQLFTSEKPWLHWIVSDDAKLTDYLWAVESRPPVAMNGPLVVRRLRGNKMRSYEDLYDEFAAALQFPHYFGENLAALDECLSDLEWLRGSCFILAISNADQLLCEEDEYATLQMIKLLATIAEEWNTQDVDTGLGIRAATPFHILLHSTAARKSELAKLSLPLAQLISEIKVI